jgi:propanediol dehydratase large subunit
MRSKRFEVLHERPINRETFIEPWPEVGLASHSDLRKAAKLMLQFIPGTDFITSGYGAIPRYDNMFGGGNFDVTELDDWHVLQRDMQVDGGIQPVSEEDA